MIDALIGILIVAFSPVAAVIVAILVSAIIFGIAYACGAFS